MGDISLVLGTSIRRALLAAATAVLVIVAGISPSAADTGTASIAGKITTPAGTDVTKATVELYSFTAGGEGSSLGLVTSVVPAANGTYRIPDLVPDTYRVKFKAGESGATNRWFGTFNYDEGSADDVTVAAGEARAAVDITTVAGAVMTGKVTAEPGVDLTKVRVSFNGPNSCAGCVEEVTSLGLDGTYRMTGLYPEPTTVGFSGGGAVKQWWDNKPDWETSNPVTLQASQTVAGIGAHLLRGATISGHVSVPEGHFSHYTQAYVFKASSTGVNHVINNGTVSEVASAHVDADGNYRVTELPAGSYRVGFYDFTDTCPERWYSSGETFQTAETLSLSLGQDAVGIDITLQPEAEISGYLSNVDTETSVTAFDATGRVAGWGTAYPNGGQPSHYYIGMLNAGTYRLAFNRGYETTTMGAQYYKGVPETSGLAAGQTVTLSTGQRLSNVNDELSVGRSISGSVVLESGQPATDYKVEAYTKDGKLVDRRAMTDNDGKFKITGLSKGEYLVVAHHGITPKEVNGLYVGNTPNEDEATLVSTMASPDTNVGVISYQAAAGGDTLAGKFKPIPPSRFLDTRLSKAVAPGGTVSFQVAGVNGIPANASAVVFNLTVTEPSSAGFITAYASGQAVPGSSNVNYGPGQTVPNLVVAPIGADGKVSLKNTSSGSVQLIADVSGYFNSGASAAPGAFQSIAPKRFHDTRTSGAVAPGGTSTFQVAGVNGIPANASAVVFNLTVTEPKAAGFITAYASGGTVPGASNVNYGPAQTVPNLVVAPIGADGKVSLKNSSSGSVQLIADVSGYFIGGATTDTGSFQSLAPKRFLDTRNSSALAAGGTTSFQVAGVNGIPAGASAVVFNLTVTEPKSAGFITAYASGSPTPGSSNVNYGPAQTVPNLVIAPIGPDGRVNLRNTSAGSVQVIADVAGYFR
ncbi:carboxypeptidase-like regulatory domain-containing protein [Arthrobacter sp. M4]|uniref:carboxypeptidase-like regulatory domain-containing protein n=1 Tax=Arthrobacter sp. M4 TaxID=218160 RepID=UPI001CDC6A45|nr:carboxypeptidase-like regulatory domain-containing protein [Arthrobacter sp. M4]MCA4132470.1 carboxypeptidase regulatory-like domain-containing protein [Arthrobacter sp. M4]